LFVERAKPPASGRFEYFDAAFPGLALRITENGGKSWCAFYRFKGRLRRFTIGRYPAIKPAQAGEKPRPRSSACARGPILRRRSGRP